MRVFSFEHQALLTQCCQVTILILPRFLQLVYHCFWSPFNNSVSSSNMVFVCYFSNCHHLSSRFSVRGLQIFFSERTAWHSASSQTPWSIVYSCSRPDLCVWQYDPLPNWDHLYNVRYLRFEPISSFGNVCDLYGLPVTPCSGSARFWSASGCIAASRQWWILDLITENTLSTLVVATGKSNINLRSK